MNTHVISAKKLTLENEKETDYKFGRVNLLENIDRKRAPETQSLINLEFRVTAEINKNNNPAAGGCAEIEIQLKQLLVDSAWLLEI
jgi:hypothetical protein